MKKPSHPLIVALDVDTLKEAQALVLTLKTCVKVFKVGSQLFTSCGPDILRFIQSQECDIFLDLKFHDIPNTVRNAVRSVVGLNRSDPDNGIIMLTVHISGGEKMLREAVAEVSQLTESDKVIRPAILGITVLTSEPNGNNIHKLVLERSLQAKKCGLDGVVLSGNEIQSVREKVGKDFIIVTPGIRPAGDDKGDQERTVTPREAVVRGCTWIVVGRPIVKAKDPVIAAQSIIRETQNL